MAGAFRLGDSVPIIQWRGGIPFSGSNQPQEEEMVSGTMISIGSPRPSVRVKSGMGTSLWPAAAASARASSKSSSPAPRSVAFLSASSACGYTPPNVRNRSRNPTCVRFGCSMLFPSAKARKQSSGWDSQMRPRSVGCEASSSSISRIFPQMSPACRGIDFPSTRWSE